VLTAERWQLDYLFDLGFQGWLVHIGVISLTAAFLFYSLPGTVWPLYWAGLMAFLSAALVGLSYYYESRQNLTLPQAKRAGYLHTLLTGCVGITWGTGAFGAASGTFETLLVYSLALGGTALGAVSSQHAVLRSCFVSLWTSVPLLAAAHYVHEGVHLPAVNAAMMILYAVILSILSLRMSGFLNSNKDLTRQLDRRLAELTGVMRRTRTFPSHASLRRRAMICASPFMPSVFSPHACAIPASGRRKVRWWRISTALLKASRLSSARCST